VKTLDGPLLRCSTCGFYYVGERNSALAYGPDSAAETAIRIEHANGRFADLPRAEERRLNELNARWRLELIERFSDGGRLLEVGCGRGDFLRVAAERFKVSGVEPNPGLARDAARECVVHQGVVEDAPHDAEWTGFDVVAALHVIEHVRSPAQFVGELSRRLRPGGLLVIETPDIGSAPFRWLGPRWRQFIPEHYYFFDRSTLARLLGERGFALRDLRSIGKHASLGLVMNRLGRQFPFLGGVGWLRIPGTVRVNPRDILIGLAVREPSGGE
jgi:2-polyprenyl-3-methyl-5-hydroxy-6-metoxy-1,4-benzoquinol methylase